ncbi:hypothetical protein ABES02_29620 [Neobacillus pocheonensis]|uniref:hypothetical protein n=1 Tax=Neobacillus pocheonensis TaxID=363869 RepID=UPI003D28718F
MKNANVALFLINFGNQTWRYVQALNDENLKELGTHAVLRDFCPNFINELKRGEMLIVGVKEGGQYRASYKAIFLEWLDKSFCPDAPFFIADLTKGYDTDFFRKILKYGTEIKTVHVWTELTEQLHPERKAGETLGIYRATPLWEIKGYVKRVPINEVYSFRIHTPTDILIQEGDRIILADTRGNTYFHAVSKHKYTGKLCVYYSEDSWDSLETLCNKFSCYVQNMNYRPNCMAYEAAR